MHTRIVPPVQQKQGLLEFLSFAFHGGTSLNEATGFGGLHSLEFRLTWSSVWLRVLLVSRYLSGS